MSRLVFAVLALIGGVIVAIPPATALAQTSTFAGTYRDDHFVLTLQPAGVNAAGYRGNIRLGDDTFAVTARATDDGLAGAFKTPTGDSFDFTATRDGQQLVFTTGGKTYRLAPAADVPPEAPANDGPPKNAGGPSFLKPGSRLTFSGGNSTLAGSHLVPDPNGWIEKNGQRFSLQQSNQSGGVGYTQLSIIHFEPARIVADVRTFLITDIEHGICLTKEHTAMVGNADALGDYWVNPQRLAAMREGRDAGDSVSRGQQVVDGRPRQTVSIRHQGADGYVSKTYDVESGLLMFFGTTDVDAAVLIQNNDNGQLGRFEGNKQFSHTQFVSVRQTNVPWAGAPKPRQFAPGSRFDYAGGRSQRLNQLPGLPQLPPLPPTPAAVRYDVGNELAADCVGTKVNARFDVGRGFPPSESNTERVFGSAMFGGLWAGIDALRALDPGQVLDDDPVTHYRTIFGDRRGNVAVVVERGPTDQLQFSYDLATGILVSSIYTINDPRIGQTEVQFNLQRGQ